MPDMNIVDKFVGELQSAVVKLFLGTKDIHYNVERKGDKLVLDFDIPGHRIHLEGTISDHR